MSNRPSDFFGASPKSVLSKPFMHVQDQKAYNVDGGTSIADAWTARDLNTVIHNDIQGASLAANEVSLPAGTYYVEGSGQFVGTSASTAILGAFVDGTLRLRGNTEYVQYFRAARFAGIVTLAAPGTLSLRYYSGTAYATVGLGTSNNTGSITDASIPSIYADLKIWQLDRSLEIAPKAVNSGLQTVPSLDTTGNIMGFDISKTGANEVTITKGSCLDSTLDIPMALTVDTALAIPAVANTIYHVFLVRLVADGSFTVKAYTTEAGVASDVLVDKWRWIGFCTNDGSGEVLNFEINDDGFVFRDGVYIATGVASGETLVDLSPFVPISRVKAVSLASYTALGGNAQMRLEPGGAAWSNPRTGTTENNEYAEVPTATGIYIYSTQGSQRFQLQAVKLRR